MPNPYKSTLNLPQTDFPMRANLVQREPAIRARWDEMDLYGRIRQADHPQGRYLLHDGPPYANGDIHIGTAVNKVLKDLVVKYKTMQGYDAPYIPGYDCHGHPIEHAVRKSLGEQAAGMPVTEIRRRCEAYAREFVEKQSEQFKLLGVLGRWDEPYLTLDPEYERREMETLASLADAGLIHRELRAIHWCATCETALAEAELEYEDETGPSLFVLFQLLPPSKEDMEHGGFGMEHLELLELAQKGQVHLMVWTTTPWTLPANLAVAVHPLHQYSAIKFGWKDGTERIAIVADELVESVAEDAGLQNVERILTLKGNLLADLTYAHPFMGPPPHAEHRQVCVDPTMVTLEEGTGLVHSAPGHGREDNLMGLRFGIPAYSPVDSRGRMDETVPEWIQGKTVWEANPVIVDHLKASGHLVHHTDGHVHRYPHCWRCHEPVIFRATEQWFVGLDNAELGKSLRHQALEAVGGVQWVPAWTESRIRAMIETRPDWCISRQKVWDVPIPALHCRACGHALLTGDMMRAAAAYYGARGSGAWYEAEPADVFGEVPACPACGATDWRKETDVFDVWLDSGVSWAGACEAEGFDVPVDLYLEGSDQHRGWFQSSLIMGVVARGQPPYRTCITHGFVVDEEGRKMSKSRGNTVSVLDETGRLGADVFRLWVSSVDYGYDIRASDTLIANLQDAYRKIRNTLRFLMGNLADFDASRHEVAIDDLEPIDRWLAARTEQLVADVTGQMEAFQFHRVYQLVHLFCANELSSFYLDVQKDRLYCDGSDWPRRRSAQTAMARAAEVLVRLIAPVLCHTAEEAWAFLPAPADGEREPSVHLARWPEVDPNVLDEDLLAEWEWLQEVRGDAYALLERFRAGSRFDKHTEARVALAVADEKERARLRELGEATLADLLLLSELRLVAPDEVDALAGEAAAAEGEEAPRFTAAVLLPQEYARCERCWTHRPSVGDGDPADLCDRCRRAVEEGT
ncbi:MAG: isoleucine--tRNA ligase [Phycisphaerae bacterium]